MNSEIRNESTAHVTLKRSLTLPLLTLYGLGVTIGAGIYVLVGATAAKAGIYAPVSFLMAACVVAFTGLSYCEMGTRYPVSAGEAAYMRHGFNSKTLSLIVGLMVVSVGVVSSAAISIGAAAYLRAFIPLSPELLTALVIVVLGLAAIWGIVESVTVAAIFTLIEIFGLGLVVYFGLKTNPDLIGELGRLVPPFEKAAWTGIASASLLAFFAFVGFEDIANVAEEVKDPGKTLPWATILTLLIATIIYTMIVSVVVLSVPMETLSKSDAPLGLLFAGSGSRISMLFGVIASIATFNGVLIQMIMSSRVLYGLASQKNLPAVIAYVNPVTRTPLVATALVVVLVLVLAFFLPIMALAELTSKIVLVVFILVNLALLRLKWIGTPPGDDVFQVPFWIPILGCLSCILLFLAGSI